MADDENQDPPAPPEPEGIRQVREALDREKARNADLATQAEAGTAAVRELAFMKAGVPTDNPVAKLYVSGYDGPMEPDAIKAGWEALGYTPTIEPPPPSEENTEPDPNEALAAARRGLSGEGGPPGAPPEGDPIERAIQAGHDAGSRGSDRAFQAYFQEIINVAAKDNPDPRVAHVGVVDDVTRERWAAEARARQIQNRNRRTVK